MFTGCFGFVWEQKGDVIDIISKSPSGLWRGHLGGRVGHFKFILVEEIDVAALRHTCRSTRRYGITQENQLLWFQKPGGLRDLLVKFNLSHLTQVNTGTFCIVAGQ